MIHKRTLLSVSVAAVAITSPALAQTGRQGAADPEAPVATAVEDVLVFGRGSSRQQSSINGATIAVEVPGTSPLKAIERLPGVSFQSADAQGLNEWSTRIVLRGFSQGQLGFTLDGMPLGDMSYGNHNGLHISRAIISENIDRVDVAQGSGVLETASSSNLGGTLQFISRDPADHAGVEVAGSFGSADTFRGYTRFDTGPRGAFGTRLSATFAEQRGDKWKGEGEANQRQLNLGFSQPAGRGGIAGFFNMSRLRQSDYQDLSLEQLDRLGRDWDNVTDKPGRHANYATAVANAAIFQANPGGDCTTNAYQGGWKCIDDAYYDSTTMRDDALGVLTVDYPLTDQFTVSLSGYFHNNQGMGGWWTPYVATTAGARDQSGEIISDPGPISVRTTEYYVDRFGFFGSGQLAAGDHVIEAGFWVEDNAFDQARRYYGLSRTASFAKALAFYEGPFRTDWEYAFKTRTLMAYIQDSWSIADAVTLNFGFKSLSSRNVARTVSGPDKTGSIKAEDRFLPQFGLIWDLKNEHQVFASYSENIRAYESSATGGPFSATAAGFRALQTTLKPESSASIEAGWRFRFDRLQGSIALYDVQFENRLLSVALGPPILGLGNGIQNVGSVSSRGLEAAALWDFADDWSVFGSLTINDSLYEDDVRDGAGNLVAATAGKRLVNIPANLARAEISYDDGGIFSTLAVAYTSERSSTYLNDEAVDGFALVEFTGGYRFEEDGSLLGGTRVQLNVTNLLDDAYIATIGSGGFQNTAGRQTFQPGAPRQVFISVRRRF